MGSGKSTFVNTLCEAPVFGPRDYNSPEQAALESTVKINPVTVEMEEDGIKLTLTIVDTPGFGDSIDNEAHFDEIIGYVPNLW